LILLALSILVASAILPAPATADYYYKMKVIVYSDGSFKPIFYLHSGYSADVNFVVNATGSLSNGEFNINMEIKSINPKPSEYDTSVMKILGNLYLVESNTYRGDLMISVNNYYNSGYFNVSQATIVDKGDRYEVTVTADTACYGSCGDYGDFADYLKNLGFNLTSFSYENRNGVYVFEFSGSIPKSKVTSYYGFSIVNSNMMITRVHIEYEIGASVFYLNIALNGRVNGDELVLPAESLNTVIFGVIPKLNVTKVRILPSTMKIYTINSTDMVIELFRIKLEGVSNPDTAVKTFISQVTSQESGIQSIELAPGDPRVSVSKETITPGELSFVSITVRPDIRNNTSSAPSASSNLVLGVAFAMGAVFGIAVVALLLRKKH